MFVEIFVVIFLKALIVFERSFNFCDLVDFYFDKIS